MPRTISLSSTNTQLAALVRWVVSRSERVVITEGSRRLAVLISARDQQVQEQMRTQRMKHNLLKRLAQVRRRQSVTSRELSRQPQL